MKSKAAILREQKQNADAAVALHTIGMKVTVLLDDGTTKDTVTTSRPWQLGHGTWVVKLEGVSGGYECARVTPIKALLDAARGEQRQ